jgi:dCTP deaminase
MRHTPPELKQHVGAKVLILEPEWEGHVTLEFSNTTPLPAKIYAGEGACQFLFLKADSVCETSYKDRAGKYMGQQGVTLPKI